MPADTDARPAHLLRAAVTCGALIACIALADAQQGERSGFLSFFTGDVEVVDSAEMRSSRIRFDAGARTNWHVHSTAQLLLIEDGQGRLQEDGQAIRVLRTGESFYTEPGLRHWHGADIDTAALQFSVYSGDLQWQEAVSDAEYLGR